MGRRQRHPERDAPIPTRWSGPGSRTASRPAAPAGCSSRTRTTAGRAGRCRRWPTSRRSPNCQDPDDSGSNSDWERATDPWTDISPNSDMWFMSLSFNDTRNLRNAMLVSKSEDGGAHWTEPVTLIDDPNPHVFNDKNSLTADPNDSDLVYAIWDRLVFPNERTQGDAFLHAAAFKGPTYFSKTENGTDDDGGDWTTREDPRPRPQRPDDREPDRRAAAHGRPDGEHADQRLRLDPQRQQGRPPGREDLGDVVDRLRRHVVRPGRDRSDRRRGRCAIAIRTARPARRRSGTSSTPTSAACAPVTACRTSPST